MSNTKPSFKKFDDRAMALDVAIEELLSHLNADQNWLPLSSSSLSRVGIDLNEEIDETITNFTFSIRLLLLFYLKNFLRYFLLILEMSVFKFINFLKYKKKFKTTDGIQLVETFLMTNRIEQNDFSDQFVSHIEIPNSAKRLYFGSIFGGGLLGGIARLKSAFRAQDRDDFLVHYEIVSFSILAPLLLNIIYFPLLLKKIHNHTATLNTDEYIRVQLQKRLKTEMLENKVDTLLRYYTGQSIVKIFNINELISWSENQIWHKVFFRGMSDAGFDLNKSASFEFFNINLDSRFASYLQIEKKYRCIPGTVFTKGNYFLERHSHYNAQLGYAFREAYIPSLIDDIEAGKYKGKKSVGIILPYSSSDSMDLIKMGSVLESKGKVCSYRLHPNNRQSKILLKALQGRKIHEGSTGEFLSTIEVFVGSGSGMCLEALVLDIPVLVPESQAFSHPLPREYFNRGWWLVNVDNIGDVSDEVLEKLNTNLIRKDSYETSHFFEPPNWIKLDQKLPSRGLL